MLNRWFLVKGHATLTPMTSSREEMCKTARKKNFTRVRGFQGSKFRRGGTAQSKGRPT